MRHNKLAGTRFLLGSRKHKPSTFTSTRDKAECNCNVSSKDMLHSKSTYFYRWFGEHLDLAVSGLSVKTSYIVPAVCGAALLGVLGLIVSPVIGNIETAYAAEEDKCKTSEDPNTGVCAMELALFMNGTDGAYNELPATELSTDNVVHRDYNFSVRAVDTKDGYDLYAGVVNTGSFGNNLVNADYPTEEHMIKALSGTDVSYNSIGNNEWGYAITSTNQSAEELSYNSLPVATITTEDDKTTLTNGKLLAHGEDTGYDPSQPVGQDKHTDQDYKLYFAAKATPESPAGHYRTQVMLSLVANPKVVVKKFSNITKMSELTSKICKNTETPPAFLDDGTTVNTNVPTKQLIDDREGSNGTKYWVAKLADGDCWMTQNMAYDGISNTSGYFNNTKKNILLVPNNMNNPTSYTEKPTTGYTISESPNMSTVLDEATKTYNGHYLMGNYYATTNNQAIDACTFSNNADWKLPDSTNTNATAAHHSFGRLLGTYNVPDSGAGSLTLRKPPFFFLYTGYYDGSFTYIGSYGNYRSTSGGKMLFLHDSFANPVHSHAVSSSYGYSVRCVVSGE